MADNKEKKCEYPSIEEMKKMVDAMLPKLPVDSTPPNLFGVIPIPEPKPFAGGYPLIVEDEQIPPDTILIKQVRTSPLPYGFYDAVKDFDVMKITRIMHKMQEGIIEEIVRQQELKDATVIEQGKDGKWRKVE